MLLSMWEPGDIIKQRGGRETYRVAELKPETVLPSGRVVPEQVYCYIIESNTAHGIRVGSFHAFYTTDIVSAAKVKRTRRVTRAKPKSSRTTPRTPRRRVPPKQ